VTPDEAKKGVDRWIEPFFTDLALRPVLIVGILIAITLGGSMLAFAFHGRNGFAIVGLSLLLGLTAERLWRDLRRRRLSRGSLIAVTLWMCSALAATGAIRLGIF
jgi:4-amino-4-deoxy-L-arabinose transferase-like glycosyltransferase